MTDQHLNYFGLLWGRADQWQEINASISHLIDKNQSAMFEAKAIARKIHRSITHLSGLMDQIGINTCVRCPDPCCLIATVWFDYTDLLFLHLNNIRPPSAPLKSGRHAVCRYLGHRGCLKNRIHRPWTCTRFLCPTQIGFLNRQNPSMRQNVEYLIITIKTARKDLDHAFIRATVFQNRPSIQTTKAQ